MGCCNYILKFFFRISWPLFLMHSEQLITWLWRKRVSGNPIRKKVSRSSGDSNVLMCEKGIFSFNWKNSWLLKSGNAEGILDDWSSGFPMLSNDSFKKSWFKCELISKLSFKELTSLLLTLRFSSSSFTGKASSSLIRIESSSCLSNRNCKSSKDNFSFAICSIFSFSIAISSFYSFSFEFFSFSFSFSTDWSSSPYLTSWLLTLISSIWRFFKTSSAFLFPFR